MKIIIPIDIHSQYASIHDSIDYTKSLQKIFYKIIDPNFKYDLNYDYSDPSPYPNFIEQEFDDQKKIEQSIIERNKKHLIIHC
jgi:hypothetical protein